MQDLTRYARQMILPEVGTDGQTRLAQAHVLVVGAGGLGCPVLQYLVGAGVGRLTVIDPDHVEESNLHRQPLYRMSDIGQPKATAASTHLNAMNAGPQVIPLVARLSPGNARNLVAQADVVVDAADSHAVSYILSDTCLALGTPLIAASVLGQSGYLGGFCGDAPSLRAVFPDLPEQGATCATAGVLGPVVGTIGAMQAQFVLRCLLGSDLSPLGRMVTVDLATLRFADFSFLGSPEPAGSFPFLSRSDVTSQDIAIELRPVQESPTPAVPRARRMTADTLLDLEVPAGNRIVMCCATGLRAWRAANRLSAKGHRNIALLAASACD